MSNRGGRSGRGGGGNRGGGPQPRDVQISKKLSYLLRHGAEKENLKISSSGYINVGEILNHRNLKSLKATFEEIRQIVQDNDKKRFTLTPIEQVEVDSNNDGKESEAGQPPSDDPKDWFIRANQGHSLKISDESLLQPITLEDLPETAVHGTSHSAYLEILASGGLKPMGRNHVHFATGLPAGFGASAEAEVPKKETDLPPPPVISGMRNSSTILIFVDLAKALGKGIKFWRSENGVILSAGEEGTGVVPLEVFRRVEDRCGEGVLVVDGRVVKEAPQSWGRRKGGRKT